jgi:hypothetical protein
VSYETSYRLKCITAAGLLNCHGRQSSDEMSSVLTSTEKVLETLVWSPFNHLMRLLAEEYFTEVSFFFKLFVSCIVIQLLQL